MTWLASTDSVKSLSDAVGELRVQVDACGQKAEQAQRLAVKIEQVGQEVRYLQQSEMLVDRQLDILFKVHKADFWGRLSWLVTGK